MNIDNDVTITGTADNINVALALNIASDKKVTWQASLSGGGAKNRFNGETCLIVIPNAVPYGGKFEMTGGSITVDSDQGCAIALGNTLLTDNSIMEISGGAVTATGNRGKAILNNKGAVTINGNAQITATGESGNAIDNSDIVSISGNAQITATGIGGVAINNSNDGTVTIDGGTVKATGDPSGTGGVVRYSIGISNNGTLNVNNGATVEMTGDGGVAIFNIGTANIAGGSISATGKTGVALFNRKADPAIMNAVTITGGAFSANGMKYVVELPLPSGSIRIEADCGVIHNYNFSEETVLEWLLELMQTQPMSQQSVQDSLDMMTASGTITVDGAGVVINGEITGDLDKVQILRGTVNGKRYPLQPQPEPSPVNDSYTPPDMTPFYGVSDPKPEQTDPKDIPSDWAAAAVKKAVELKLVPERLQGKWRDNLSRADFCALAVKLYEYLDGKPVEARAYFDDTSDMNIQKLAGLGIVTGDGTGKFDPNGAFTREMALTLMYNMMVQLGHTFEPADPSFADADTISPWAKTAIGALQKAGVVSGDGQYFNPSQVFTREMGILTVVNFLTVLT